MTPYWTSSDGRPLGRYHTIVADPPWRYIDPATKAHAEKYYPTMTAGEMVMLDVADLADDDCHLWLWTTNAFMEAAHRLVRAWGFMPLTIVTWCKPGPGVGHYVRNNTEHIIFASRGRPQVPEHKPLSSWYIWPRGRHSVKPDGFFGLVEQVSPGPYIELFARRRRPGWDAWGNEAPEAYSDPPFLAAVKAEQSAMFEESAL